MPALLTIIIWALPQILDPITSTLDDSVDFANLSSDVASVRHAAFVRLWNKAPTDMSPLIALVNNMKPSINANGNKYYKYDDDVHYAIKLLGHHRVADSIVPLIEHIGYPNYDQFASITGSYPSTVQALANIGKQTIPHVIKKLGALNQDGIKRMNCLLVIVAIHQRDFSKPAELIKEKLNEPGLSDAERTNLQAALIYATTDFLHPKLPYPNDWRWR